VKDTGDSSICENAEESRVESLLGLRRMGLMVLYFAVDLAAAAGAAAEAEAEL
jgi:hypothetical protein